MIIGVDHMFLAVRDCQILILRGEVAGKRIFLYVFFVSRTISAVNWTLVDPIIPSSVPEGKCVSAHHVVTRFGHLALPVNDPHGALQIWICSLSIEVGCHISVFEEVCAFGAVFLAHQTGVEVFHSVSGDVADSH